MTHLQSPGLALRLTLLCGLAGCSLSATAQFVDDDFRIRTVPEIAVAGEPVRVILEGTWATCLPVGVRFSGTGQRRIIALQAPPDGTICAAVIQPISAQLGDVLFDERDAGTIAIAIVYSTGELLGLASLAVQSADPMAPSTSTYDVNGTWYSPESSGSGLVLVHDKSGERDGVVGGWANFRPDGSARWYALEGSGWVSPSTLAGTVYQAMADAFSCEPGGPTPACDFDPRSATELVALGTFSIEFQSADQATLVMSQADSSGQPRDAEPVELIRLR